MKQRLEHIKYLCNNTDKHPKGIDLLYQPIAVYDRNGVIVKASKQFLQFTGNEGRDVAADKINITDCLNDKNGVMAAAAMGAVCEYQESILRGLHKPMKSDMSAHAPEAEKYKEAAFFYMLDTRTGEIYGAVLFMRKYKHEDPTDDEVNDKEPRSGYMVLSIAAVLILVAAFVIGVMIAATNRSGKVSFDDMDVPLAALIQVDDAARPYTGKAPERLTGDAVKILSLADMAIPADATDIQILLLNPGENDCNLVFEIILTDASDVIYTSGLVEPGFCIESAKLAHGLPEGEYKALLKVLAYAPDDTTFNSEATLDFILTAARQGE